MPVLNGAPDPSLCASRYRAEGVVLVLTLAVTIACAFGLTILPAWIRPAGSVALLIKGPNAAVPAGVVLALTAAVLMKRRGLDLSVRLLFFLAVSLFGSVLIEPLRLLVLERLEARPVLSSFPVTILLATLSDAFWHLVVPLAALRILGEGAPRRRRLLAAGALSLLFSLALLAISSSNIRALFALKDDHVTRFDPYSVIPFSLAIVGAGLVLLAAEIVIRIHRPRSGTQSPGGAVSRV